jgi:WD40 repeat protein
MNIVGESVLQHPISAVKDAVVTDLNITEDYILVALSNVDIHIFDIHEAKQRIPQGSQNAVWALPVQGDILASGGKDTDIRTRDLSTG